MRSRTAKLGSAGGLFIFVHAAEAHEIVPGLTGFPSLLLHPLVYTDHLLSILVAILLSARADRVQPWQLGITFAAGLVAARILHVDSVALLFPYWIAKHAIILAAALLTAALPRPTARTSAQLIVSLAALVGWGTTGEGPAWADQVEAVLAASITSVVLISAVGWLLSRFQGHQLEIGLRAIAAWIAASTAMVLAMAFRN